MNDAGRRRAQQSWSGMKQRCFNPKSKQYKNYGARGITMCPEWVESFDQFFADMGPRPAGMTIDRIDNDAGYFKGNCRWATPLEQRRNQRTCRYVEFNGERKLLRDWAKDIGIHETTLSYRIIRLGWSIEKTLTTRPMTRQEITSLGGYAMAAQKGGAA